MANLSLYPSIRMFEALDQTIFNDAKNAFISNAFSDSYEPSTVKERWRLLMDAFKTVVPEADRESMEALCLERLEKVELNGVIRLEQMLKYFETFYFLCATQASEFSLDENQKTLFFEDLRTAMQEACESGRQQKFENVIRYHRRDLDWVLNTLHLLRYQLLSSMQDAYNAENFDEEAYQAALNANQNFWLNDGINHRFDDAFHIWDAHTLSVMTKLAEDNQLGITTLQSINDIYAYDGSPREIKIKRYFNTKYKNVFFKEYPSQILNALTQHALYEITTLFQNEPHELDLSDWQQNKVPMSRAAFNQFTSLLDSLLPEHNTMAELISYDEETAVPSLCEKGQLLTFLETSIKNKLRSEGFAYDLTKEAYELNQAELFHPCFHSQLAELKEFNLLFSNIEAVKPAVVNDFISRNLATKNGLPLEFHSIFIERPSLIYSLPKRISQHIDFTKGLIEQFNVVLAEQKDYQASHISALTYLCQNDASVIKFMSPALLNNKPLLTSLINVDDSAFFHASSVLKSDEVLAFNAVAVNGFAIFHASPDLQNNNALILSALHQLGISVEDDAEHDFASFQNVLSVHYAVFYYNHNLDYVDEYPLKNPSQLLTCDDHLKMFALEQLVTKKNVSTDMMARYARQLNPKIFLWAIEWRNYLGLPSLPLCNKQTLQAYINSVELNDGVDSALICVDKLAGASFTQLRQSAYHLLSECNEVEFNLKKIEDKQCLKAFVQHNNWFDGFCENQRAHPYLVQPFNSFSDVLKQLWLSAKTLLLAGFKLVEYIGKLLFDFANLLMRILAVLLVAFIFSVVISFVLASLIPVAFSLILENVFQLTMIFICHLGLRSLNASSDNVFIKALLHIQQIFSWILPLATLTKLILTIMDFGALLKHEYNLLGLAIAPLFTRTVASITAVSLSAHEKIEYIISQLQQKKTSSADSKAEMLKALWQCIQCDKTYLSGTMTLSEAIEKNYEFMHQGESVIQSFSDVSKCHRNDNETFQLEATSRPWCGLFHSKTSSESALMRLLAEDALVTSNTMEM